MVRASATTTFFWTAWITTTPRYPGIAGGVLGADPESTQEFRVITNNFNAEFGRNTGAIIDVVTKSGTNDFHGNAYEFGRWNALAAPETGSTGPMPATQDPYTRNQFGYSIGGPIIKNKTFFFFNDELDRFRTTLTNTATVPTRPSRQACSTYFGRSSRPDPGWRKQRDAGHRSDCFEIQPRLRPCPPTRPCRRFSRCIRTRPSTTETD